MSHAQHDWQPRPEWDFVPYQPLPRLRSLGVRSLLVLAPHPDDEVFGCGGLLALALAEGIAVDVAVVSDGAAGGEALAREHECRAAAAVLGAALPYRSLAFWRLPDRGVRPDGVLVERIREAARPGGAPVDWVLAPSPFEIHPDHRAVCQAALRALAPGASRLAFYEVGQAQPANTLVDITPVIATKRAAMACFASQLAVQDYGEHVAALNRYRSYTLGPGVTHAEAYWSVDPAIAAGGIAAVLADAARQLAARFDAEGA